MTDDLSRDIEVIAGEIPAAPRGLAELRQILGTMPTASPLSLPGIVPNELPETEQQAQELSAGTAGVSGTTTSGLATPAGTTPGSTIIRGSMPGLALLDKTVEMTKFVTSIVPPRVVLSLPTLPDPNYPLDCIVFNATDEDLYKNVAGTWTLAAEGDLTANRIYAGAISAGAISARELATTILLASLIKTAETGTRVEIDQDGIRAYNGTTLILLIPTDGSDVYIDAEVNARALSVAGNAEFLGDGNILAGGALLTLMQGISNPVTKPALETSWAYTTMTGLPNYGSWAGEYNATGGSGGATAVYYVVAEASKVIYEINASTGAYIRTLTPASLSGLIAGVAQLGGYVYIFDYVGAGSVVRRYSETTFALDTTYSSVSFPVGNTRIGSFASDGTYLYILQWDTSTTLKWNKYDSAMVKQGATTSITSSEINDPYDLKVGQFDFGADRMVIVQNGVTSAHVYDLTGTHKTDECFPIQNASGAFLIWNGTSFLTEAGYGGSAPNLSYYFNTHTGWTWATATSDTVWVAYSWYDSNATGGLHETLVSPKQSITMGRRKRLSVTMPALPGAGGTDDPNNRRVYVAHSATEPTSANMDLQATTTSTVATLTSYDSGGAAPPTSNNFPSGGIAEIKAVGGQWSLKGDGYVKLPGGTSFPTSPATNDRYWRTDLDLEFFYDGTRWLSTTLFAHELHHLTGFHAAISATQGLGYLLPMPYYRGTSDVYLDTLLVRFLVQSGGTALSASHKWVMSFYKRDSAATDTSITTVTIDSGSSNVFRTIETSIAAVVNTSASFYTFVGNWTKTGTPGDLIRQEMLYFRLVAT